MTSIVVEEELGAMPAIEQILRERGFSVFTIPYVEAGYFTGGDYFAEVTQYTPSSVICTPRFSAPGWRRGFFQGPFGPLPLQYPFQPLHRPLHVFQVVEEQMERGGLWPLKGGKYALSKEIQPLGGSSTAPLQHPSLPDA